jgi:hypothetical protein
METAIQHSILNVEVSAWGNYFEAKTPKPVSLMKWLTSSKYAPQVEAIRKATTKQERDAMKAQLPAITPSGTFSSREEEGLLQHSGFIQIDIDFQDNTHITNFNQLKEELAKVENIAFLGLSVSGTGFWGLIPILHPDKHKQHFAALKNDFLALGIRLDEKPGNVASLRGYSWDPKAHFNHNAIPYAKLYEVKPEAYKPNPSVRFEASTESEKVEAILNQIEAHANDITSGYSNWFNLGCALANEFGEAGRDYFHRVSQFNHGYSQQETDKQFDRCKKNYKIKLATFFLIAKQHGFTWKEVLVKPPSKSEPLSAPPQRPKLPPGMALVNGTLEVDGLPFQWLTEEEQRQAQIREIEWISGTASRPDGEPATRGKI